MSSSTPAEAPRDLVAIKAQEDGTQFPAWNSDMAFDLGIALRRRLLNFPQATAINISTFSNPPHVFFHSVTHSGTTYDNDVWIARKRNTVLRWGRSTWFMHNKFEGNEAVFREKFALGDKAGEYAIHGGGMPVYVKGVETPVAVVVVSGLKQDWDHQVVVEELSAFVKGM